MSSIYMSATSDGQLLDLSPRRKSAPTSHQEHGQVVAKFSDFHAFAVSGYLGDSTHNYCFVQVRERASSFPLLWGANLTSLLSGKTRLMLPESLTVHDALCMSSRQSSDGT